MQFIISYFNIIIISKFQFMYLENYIQMIICCNMFRFFLFISDQIRLNKTEIIINK